VVETASGIILAMQEAAPPGQHALTDSQLSQLGELTRELIASRPDAVEERQRFNSIRERCIPLNYAELRNWLQGKTVVVTGGTGCIGSTLLAEIGDLGAARLVSVSRGLTSGWPQQPGTEYLHADVADRASLTAVLGQVKPDVVFHVAAQRDPGLAEREVHRTVATNIFGTRNVVQVAEESGAADVICATSGKALRPYSHEVYTAAKRSAEYLLATEAARADMRLAAVRFTHVVNNSIVDDRLLSWARGGVVRLHDPATMFYGQSARESAQLMLCGGLGARRGSLRIFAINDLGWPVSLLDLAIGTLQQAGSASPIYFSGHDPGYESVAFPGLYDPATAGDVSPLLSAFEAIRTEQDLTVGVDACTATFDLARVPAEQIVKLENACRAGADTGELRSALDELSWYMLDAVLAALPAQTLARAAALTEPHAAALSCDHRKMLAAIRAHVNSGQPAVV
jgi:nucleoside-diphosphate-sugar epimerase